MEQPRLEAFVGGAMVVLGLLQAGHYAAQNAWIPTALGVVFSLLGAAFLWAEVYSPSSNDGS